MSASRCRVWVEEVRPPAELRFTWQTPEDFPLDANATGQAIQKAVAVVDGVVAAELSPEGLNVEIDPAQVTRYDLATTIRKALAPEDEAATPIEIESRVRIWAEDLTSTEMRITWEVRESEESDGIRQQRRRVAAWLSVFAGVRSTTLDDEGVVVRYDPAILARERVGDDVRAALADDMPLRERTDQLLKRATTYGNLARKLALDDRISPLPSAAKQAVAARAAGGTRKNMAVRTAARFVPGAALITRVQMLLPMLTELSQWSRDADPEIVDGHLASVGLDRDILRRDTITAHEMRYYARDSAAEHAAALGERASSGARQALAAGREMLASLREATDSSNDRVSTESKRTPQPSADEPPKANHPANEPPVDQH